MGFFNGNTATSVVMFRFCFPVGTLPDIETPRQGYLRSYPVGKSVRASGVR
jgi:hypothetical protein